MRTVSAVVMGKVGGKGRAIPHRFVLKVLRASILIDRARLPRGVRGPLATSSGQCVQSSRAERRQSSIFTEAKNWRQIHRPHQDHPPEPGTSAPAILASSLASAPLPVSVYRVHRPCAWCHAVCGVLVARGVVVVAAVLGAGRAGGWVWRRVMSDDVDVMT